MNKIITYSNIIDELIKEERLEKETKEKADKLRKDNNDKAIEELVFQQYDEAIKIIGTRLSLKKEHPTYYGFFFSSRNKMYSCHIFAKDNYGLVSKFVISETAGWVGYCDRKINLEDLATVLIDWVRLNLEKEGVL